MRTSLGWWRRHCLQIVIAGASQTALSCLEQLLLQRHISFNSLTLLAPGGVPVGGVACTYTAGLVARMGVQAAVTIVDGQMASLDTEQKLVGLDDGSQLPYDLLVMATGLQVCALDCGGLTGEIRLSVGMPTCATTVAGFTDIGLQQCVVRWPYHELQIQCALVSSCVAAGPAGPCHCCCMPGGRPLRAVQPGAHQGQHQRRGGCKPVQRTAVWS